MILLVILGYALLVIYEFVPLYKQKLWRDFGLNCVLGSISLLAAVLLSLDVTIPSPALPIKEVITYFFGK